jgi:hypothetical protein
VAFNPISSKRAVGHYKDQVIMATLRIPKPFEQGIVKVFSLPDDQAASLQAALQESPLLLRPKALAASISGKVKGLSEAEIEQIISTLTSLYMARATLEIPSAQFLDELVEAIEESESKPANLTEATRDPIKQKLAALLNIESFGVAVKAQEVLHEHQYALSRVRILTDIRPVFKKDEIDAPVAMVLVHTLKLTYLTDGRMQDFFVAMDTSDIKIMKDALERAEKKAESLREIIAATHVGLVEPE